MSRVDFCSFALYREATTRMTGGINTFSCGNCGKFREIWGRKILPSPGRSRKWQCAACAATAATTSKK